MSSYWITVDPKSSDRSLYKRGHTETVRGRDWDGCRPRSPEDCPEPQKAGKKPRKHLPYSVQRQPGPWHLDLWLLVSGTERSHILWFIVICSEAVGTVVVLSVHRFISVMGVQYAFSSLLPWAAILTISYEAPCATQWAGISLRNIPNSGRSATKSLCKNKNSFNANAAKSKI